MEWKLSYKYAGGAFLFLLAGLAALVLDQPLLVVIPFVIVLLPFLFSLIISRTHLLFYGLIAFLPLSTEINFTPLLGMDFPDEILMILATAFVIMKVLYRPSIVPMQFFNHPLVFILALHLMWIIISVVFSTEPILSLKFFLAKTWFIVSFVVLPYFILKDRRSITLLGVVLLISMGLVIVQALIRHGFYNFSFESVKEIYWPFFRNHVNFSAMLICLLAVLFSIYKLTPSGSKKQMLLLSITAGVAALFLAYSRGAWLALIVGISSSFLIRKKLIGQAIIAAVICLVVASTWLMANNKYLEFGHDYNTTIFHENFKEHLQATVQFKDVSNAERFYRWIAGFNMVADKPITGFGPNTFYSNYRSYTEIPFKTWVSNNPEHSSVHNYFLLTAIEQGLPGLMFFCFLYFGMILYSQRLYHYLRDAFYKQIALTIGVILAMIGALIFVSDLIETDKIGSIFWLCLSLLIVLEKMREKSST